MAGNPITTQAFNHWMFVAAKSNATQSGTTQVIVPTDPPEFKGCIKQVRQQIPSLSKTPDKTLKADCSQLFTELNSQVMDFLIKAYWYQADAYKQGIHLTTAQVNKAFDNAKKKEFKTPTQYQTFLTETGQTNADILYRVRVNTLYQKLLKAQTKDVTAAAVESYYDAHKSQFGSAPSRNLLLVRTKTKSAADQALAALNSGQSWSAVAAKYSVDAATKKSGGVLEDVTKGQEEHALNQVAFSAPVGKLEGPVHGTFGWYVVKVTKTNPGSQQPLSKATVTIEQLLKSNAQTAAGTAVNDRGQEELGRQDDLPRRVFDGRLQGLQAAEDDDVGDHADSGPEQHAAPRGHVDDPERATTRRRRRRGRGWAPAKVRVPGARTSGRRCCASIRSPGVCGSSAPGTGSRTSGRSSRTPSRRPTSWPTPPTAATIASSWTSSATCCSRFISWRCCLEERGAGDLAQVARHATEKLIRRHPHVFAETEVADAAEVLRNWDAIKGDRGGPRARSVRRSAREPARAAVREEGAAASCRRPGSTSRGSTARCSRFGTSSTS